VVWPQEKMPMLKKPEEVTIPIGKWINLKMTQQVVKKIPKSKLKVITMTRFPKKKLWSSVLSQTALNNCVQEPKNAVA
jgi:hypothetical protein